MRHYILRGAGEGQWASSYKNKQNFQLKGNFEQNINMHDLNKTENSQIYSVMLHLTGLFKCSRISQLQLRFTNTGY